MLALRSSVLMLLVMGTFGAASASEPSEPSEPSELSEPERSTKEPGAADKTDRGGARVGKRIEWQPEWRRFGWANGIVGVGAWGAAGVGLLVGPTREQPRTMTWSVDERLRDGFRVSSPDTRRALRRASDLTLAGLALQAYVVDPLLNAAWYRDSPDVAWQLEAINVQVLGLSVAVQIWTSNLFSRDRPYGRFCDGEEELADGSNCVIDYRYRSFYSGHASSAFALATATCTHHAYVPLYRGQAGWVPCAVGLTLATATTVGRFLVDHHYASDGLAGAAIGSFIGWIVPWLHYETGFEQGQFDAGGIVRITIVPTPRGLAAQGIF